jgi:phenylpropionate dioxygenase-like ring-hydroxylating dioxygenase large terminal subunit
MATSGIANKNGIDAGTAYGLTDGHHEAALTEVSRGTPMGELMRRYWHAIGLREDATDLPKAVRVLGEDLILFRDTSGTPGLVQERCMHRGSSLLYARVDDCGIRCCYHGWAFDTQGMCTDQPCEPQNGLQRDKFRQPWYPVEERYGLIWAYLGPPEHKPLLQRYNLLEEIGEGEQLFTDDYNIGSGRTFNDGPVPFNWLQHFENIMDYGHFMWLHYFHSGPQFGSRYGEFDTLDFQPWERMANVEIEVTERGVLAERKHEIPDGRVVRSITETVLPGVRGVPNPFGGEGRTDSLGFLLPVDDTNFRIFTVLRSKDRTFYERIHALRARQDNPDPTHVQRFPGDWEAQGSQGAITLHSEEHLASSDRGVRMLRRLLREQIDVVATGGHPMNVAFEPGTETINLTSGQYFD